jgi:hypothetical protein
MNTEDRRNVIDLNKHLDSQMMTGEEEAIYDNDVEDALIALVDDHLLDINSELLTDALLACHSQWHDFIQAIPQKGKAYSMGEALSDAKMSENVTQALLDGLVDHLREALRKEAEESVR